LASGKLPSSILQEAAKALPADQASAQTTDAFLSAETLDKPRKKTIINRRSLKKARLREKGKRIK